MEEFLTSITNQIIETYSFFAYQSFLSFFIFKLNNVQVKEAYFFSFTIPSLILYFGTRCYHNSHHVKQLVPLDSIQESYDYFRKMTSQSQFYSIHIVFQIDDPVCHSGNFRK